MRTDKYQIRNHPKNKRLGNMLDEFADVHNHFLRLEKRYFRMFGKSAGRYKLQPHLTKLLKRTKGHWTWIPRDTLDDVIIRLELAWQKFFFYKKNGGRKVGVPKPKKRHKMRSAKFQTGYKLEDGRVRISFKSWDEETQSLTFDKIWYSFHQHRPWQGHVKYIQISRDSVGVYWLTIVTDDSSTEPLPATGKSVGADFGLKTFLTLSNGEKGQNPQFLKQSLDKLRSLNKSVSRKQKGSGNFYRAIRALARQYRKISNQRRDWQWKLATDLCRRFDTLAFEILNIDGMKRLWGRKVSDLGFYLFIELLKYKCFKHNRQFLQVGQWTPTTKPCSNCGWTNKSLTLDDRQWTCPSCRVNHDRDVNAAINILRGCLEPLVEQT